MWGPDVGTSLVCGWLAATMGRGATVTGLDQAGTAGHCGSQAESEGMWTTSRQMT